MDKSLEDKILHARTTAATTVPTRIPAESPAAQLRSALTSTSPPVVNASPATSHITAAGVVPTHTPPSTAAVTDSQPAAAPTPPVPATAAKSKVAQCQQNQRPTVSTSLNVDSSVLELVNHPDRSFVNNLVNALRYGARIGYLGPQQTRVSRNLLSASQHPEVVSANLNMEMQLGRVAGPFLSPTTPGFLVSSHRCGPQETLHIVANYLSPLLP